MSGHSKWHSIKQKKGAADAKRGAIFSKMAKNIMLAARGGADPATNFKLRMAIASAKAVNLPKDNIERAIKKGSGEGAEGQIEEVVYEGLGPDKIPVVVKVLTDNRNRAASSLKHIFAEAGGALGAPVMWQFEKKGVIRIPLEALGERTLESLELPIIDLGAQDIQKTETDLKIIGAIEDLQKINEGLEKLGLTADSAEMEFVAKDQIKSKPELETRLTSFFDALDEDEDVDNYFTNIAE